MQIGDKVRLLSDVVSFGKSRKIYGKKNEIVTIASINHLPVLLVDSPKEKFSVHIDNTEAVGNKLN